MLQSELAASLHDYLNGFGYPLIDAVFYDDGEFSRIEVSGTHPLFVKQSEMVIRAHLEAYSLLDSHARTETPQFSEITLHGM